MTESWKPTLTMLAPPLSLSLPPSSSLRLSLCLPLSLTLSHAPALPLSLFLCVSLSLSVKPVAILETTFVSN